MTPKRNYEKLYSFPEVWKAIFQLIRGSGSGNEHKKGIGDPYIKELQDIYIGITKRKYYPKSFPKVWRALRYLCKLYDIEVPSSDDDGEHVDARGENESDSELLKKININNPGKTKTSLEP